MRWHRRSRLNVSIRAPARGATIESQQVRLEFVVSIRAPARGATNHMGAFTPAGLFQSAPPHGERLSAVHISTVEDGFNPRPRTGSDLGPHSLMGVSTCFNPRPRTGSDNSRVQVTACIMCFNPRPRTGSDRPASRADVRDEVSIRAPARGATRDLRGNVRCIRFQSAPPHGERRARTDAETAWPCFNPRPRTGSDSVPPPITADYGVSIRAPARGATGPPRPETTSATGFNPRPRTGSDA